MTRQLGELHDEPVRPAALQGMPAPARQVLAIVIDEHDLCEVYRQASLLSGVVPVEPRAYAAALAALLDGATVAAQAPVPDPRRRHPS